MFKEILKILKDENKITKNALDILKNQVSKCKELCISLKDRKLSKSRH
jgi:hypothetical protein